MQAKPKPKWQLLQRLNKPEVVAHLAAITEMVKAAAAEHKTLTTTDIRAYLEPLLKHYHLSHRNDTLADEINTATGLNLNKFTYAKAAKEWGIPPANGQGRGLAKPAGQKHLQFNSR